MPTAKPKTKLGADLGSRGSAYERYKRTTRAFRDCLAKLIPSKLRLVSVSDLVLAAEHVLETSKKASSASKRLRIQQSLLDNLDETIELRETVGATYNADETDDGHRHMIQVLKYCRVVLGASRMHLQRSGRVDENDSGSYNKGGRYGVLGEDSDLEDEDTEDPDDGPYLERPLEPTKDYSIENDLVIGSLAFQANLFFLTAENLFETVADAYETLKQTMGVLKRSDLGFKQVNHQTVVHLMQATATVNLVIENVRYLEKSFFLESSHLDSIYHVFAVLVFQDRISELEAVVGPQMLAKNPRICVYFAGICVRVGFLGAEFYLSRFFEDIFKDMFVTKKQIKPKLRGEQLEELKKIGISICASADIEKTLDPGVPELEEVDEKTKFVVKFTKKDGSIDNSIWITSPQWLKNYGRLGGKSGLMYTFAQLEKLKMEPWKGDGSARSSGNMPDGNMPDQSFRSTRQILDTVFGNDLLPLLFHMHHCGWLGLLPGIVKRKEFSTCMPFLREFNDLMAGRRGNTDFSAAFGVHALVHGIFVLQGDDDWKRLAVLSKLTVGKFEAQIDEMLHSEYTSCLQSFKRSAVKEVKTIHDALSYYQTSSVKAFWNPLLAGSFLLTVTFSSNMARGFCYMDVLMQTRIALHLYHSLRQRKMIDTIDLLELLDSVLISNKRVWPIGKPDSTGLLKSFCLAVGDSSRVADRYIEFLRVKDTDEHRMKAFLAPSLARMRSCTKAMSLAERNALARVQTLYLIRQKYSSLQCGTSIDYRIFSEESSSCKCMVDKVFPDTQSSEKHELTAELGATCARQASVLREKIGEEHEMLSLNWLKVGHLLNEFVEELFDCIGISPLIDEYNGVLPVDRSVNDSVARRDIGNKFLLDMVFRELQFQDNEKLCVHSKKVAEFMSEYFTTVATRDAATFF